MWSAVSILIRGVIDTVHLWSAVSLTPPTSVYLQLNFFNQICLTEQLAKMFEKIDWSAVSLTPLTTKSAISKLNFSANNPHKQGFNPWRWKNCLIKKKPWVEKLMTQSL
jgi:hypothetical protein